MYFIKWFGFVIPWFISTVMMYHQDDYIGTYERVEVASYDKEYVGHAKTVNFKYNRTQAFSNITMVFNQDYGYDLQVQIQAYRFASNEYRFFPIQLTYNLCNAINKNEFGIQDYYKCGNFTKCPMVKGRFLMCNYAPSFSEFPPHIPQGRYQLDMTYIYRSVEILRLQGFATITKIEKLRFA